MKERKDEKVYVLLEELENIRVEHENSISYKTVEMQKSGSSRICMTALPSIEIQEYVRTLRREQVQKTTFYWILYTVYTCCRSVLLPPGAANERAAVPAGAFSQLISLEGNLSGRGLIDKYRMAADAKTNQIIIISLLTDMSCLYISLFLILVL